MYIIETKPPIDLGQIGEATLRTIGHFRVEGIPIEVRYNEPQLINRKKAYDLYVLGTFIYNNSCDRVFLFDIRDVAVLSSDILGLIKEQKFSPNIAISLGIESANGFDNGPFHKNLSSRRLDEALEIGRQIGQCEGIERVLFIHSLVDNREVTRSAVKIRLLD